MMEQPNIKLEHITPSPLGGGDRGGAALALSRAPRFSPNNVDNDRLILQAVAERVGESLGVDVPIIDEEAFCANPVDADLYLSMGRLPETLALLSEKEQDGSVVINSTIGVRLCSHRLLLDRMMRQWDISMPPVVGNEGYWLKRGDSVTQCDEDVVYCPDEASLNDAMTDFSRRGIVEVVKSAHVKGEQIKFYGVADRMFRFYYNDAEKADGQYNDMATIDNHYPFNAQALRSEVIRLSHLTHVDIYGGDAIVDKNGNYFIIDFNDWPTFRNCREEAAEEIERII